MKQLFSWPVLYYIRLLAKLSLKKNKPKTIIGVCGSVGKSSTTSALHAVLSGYGRAVVVGNSETGIPLGILGIEPESFTLSSWITMLFKAPLGIGHLRGTDFLIVEMGIDDPFPPKNMEYLLTILTPDIGVIVTESGAHTEQFEKALTKQEAKDIHDSERLSVLIEKITKEDMKMLSSSKVAVINADNLFISSASSHLPQQQAQKISFGADENNTVTQTQYSVTTEGTTFGYAVSKESTTTDISFALPTILPEAYKEVFAACISTIVGINVLNEGRMQIPLSEVGQRLSDKLELPKGRGSIFPGIKDSLIIDSSYNASRSSVTTYLSLLKELKQQTGKPVVFLFGDMRELGKEAEAEHQEVAQEIGKACDYVYLVGPLTDRYVLPVLEKKELKELKWFGTNRQAGEYLRESLPKNCLILVKGSQNTLFLEESIKYILSEKKDALLLCRQEKFWKEVKRSQGKLAALSS